jgi:hypothetical protein
MLAKAAEKLGHGAETISRNRTIAEQVRFYEPLHNGMAFILQDDERLDVYALVKDRIVGVELKLTGTPQQTLDSFLKRYRSRSPFQIPQGPGVCLPYAFLTGGVVPASVGVSMRLRAQPDIVIYLREGKEWTLPEQPKNLQAHLSQTAKSLFCGAIQVNPVVGDLNPFRATKIDGREGLGVFATVTRDAGLEPTAINNEAHQDQDWAYLAYVPADKTAAPGVSFDLYFKVERFGRFAKRPMSEKEFRDLVKSIAASIKRRPEAWAAH